MENLMIALKSFWTIKQAEDNNEAKEVSLAE